MISEEDKGPLVVEGNSRPGSHNMGDGELRYVGARPKLEMSKNYVSRGPGTSCRAFVPI